MLLIGILQTLFIVCSCHTKVKLKDITSITLQSGEYTTARRSAAVSQLKCVKGSAKGHHEPKVVQCYNRGFDGSDVQWECKAELKSDVEFGNIQVSCEGYDYPDDPYVLKGSCGLEYELNYVDDRSHQHHKKDDEHRNNGWSAAEKLVVFAIVCFIIYVIYSSITSPREDGDGGHGPGGFRGGPSFPGPGPDGRPAQPPPPGFKTNFEAPPPSYEETCNRQRSYDSSGSDQRPNDSGPGFFTGLGLGALAGYAFGNNQSSDSGYFRRRGYSDRNTDFFSQGPSTSRRSPSSSETRTSSGFGGTSRR